MPTRRRAGRPRRRTTATDLSLNAKPASNGASLNQLVEQVVKQYLEDMGSTPPDNLHAFIMREVERPLIQTVLDHVDGNQSRAATILGITRTTLRTRIQRYGL
ncbi:hypothetical protein AY599_02445 [Leptolyngbya valderiana BDU 20041]|nr:hypothetical protein AY599_02445 [Leptolyngbya valderiana BDU 20041]